MIPYFTWMTIQLGPVTLYVWGLFVSLGAVTSLILAGRAARRRGVQPALVTDAATRMLIAGFLGARIGHVLLYDIGSYLDDPLELFRVWHGGFSSIGGFLGALFALASFVHRRREPLLPLADCLAESFPLGWAVGRIGCFLIHDHPGTLSHSVFAVQYPGGSRFDLGLIDALTMLFVECVLLGVLWKTRRPGAAVLAVAWTYLPIRFLTDFLRATDLPGSDVRYGGLTPAQWGAIAIFFASVLFFPKIVRRKSPNPRIPDTYATKNPRRA